jgi:hypothetical protein
MGGNMSSTGVKVTNKSDITIIAKLVWGVSEVSSATIRGAGNATLPAEYVWYDLNIFNDNTKEEILQWNGVYGNSAWLFAGNVHDGYQITQA